MSAIHRSTIVLVASLTLSACTGLGKDQAPAREQPETLYVFPDGSMHFRGRAIDDEDVVIYDDGRGGERAAVRLVIPRHPDVYRDTITVERRQFDVPVQRRGE